MNTVEDYRCKECGNTILFDAWVMWNPQLKDYEIMNVTEDCFCENCELNPEIEEIQVPVKI